jgi:hypothetical protein
MKAKTQKAQPKKIGIAEAFKLWMGGKGRSELAEATDLTRGELRKAFKKHSGKSWKELQIESGRKKEKKAKAAAKEVRQRRAA